MGTVFSKLSPSSSQCVQDHHVDLRRIIAQCESMIKAFQGIHATTNRTKFAEHLKSIRRHVLGVLTWKSLLQPRCLDLMYMLPRIVIYQANQLG